MIFSSYTFLFAFLPLCFVTFAVLVRSAAGRVAAGWIVVCSLAFYAWWSPVYLPLLLGSMTLNYAIGRALSSPAPPATRKMLLAVGLIFDLALLGYFKYAGFLIDSLNAAAGSSWRWTDVTLPLAISFFTFQQIAYLADVYGRRDEEHDVLDYAFFVTFFPQLIAGPIVLHREIVPQLRAGGLRLDAGDCAVGWTIFQIGLAKKVLLADALAPYVSTTFDAAAAGTEPTFAAAWIAGAAFLLQIYFDFSGYSDMAIGLARLFGLRLPFNFASPLKASSAIDFWARWHITLTRFFRDHVWHPLGGGSGGETRRTVLRIVVFLLIGLWHGAAWTFVVFGLLNGLYIVVNHAFRAARQRRVLLARNGGPGGRRLATALTFAAITVSAVFFRAPSFACASRMLGSMLGGNGLDLGAPGMNAARWALLVAALAIVWLLPNTQQIMHRYRPGLGTIAPRQEPAVLHRIEWRPSLPWAIALTLSTVACILQMSRAEPFIYYQF
jgi:alginate O-acetyltransferase complex protein AlgI